MTRKGHVASYVKLFHFLTGVSISVDLFLFFVIFEHFHNRNFTEFFFLRGIWARGLVYVLKIEWILEKEKTWCSAVCMCVRVYVYVYVRSVHSVVIVKLPYIRAME